MSVLNLPRGPVPDQTLADSGGSSSSLHNLINDNLQDTPAAIQKVAQFLGKQLTPHQTASLADHLHIANFRMNPAVNSEAMYDLGIMRREEQAFIRKGRRKSRKRLIRRFPARAGYAKNKWGRDGVLGSHGGYLTSVRLQTQP